MISLECAKDLFFGSCDLAKLFVMCVRFKGKTELMRGRERCVVAKREAPAGCEAANEKAKELGWI
jgi:hypothetical protein